MDFSSSNLPILASSSTISASFCEMASSLASSADFTAMDFSSSNLSIFACSSAISLSLAAISPVSSSLVLLIICEYLFSSSAWTMDIASAFSFS